MQSYEVTSFAANIDDVSRLEKTTNYLVRSTGFKMNQRNTISFLIDFFEREKERQEKGLQKYAEQWKPSRGQAS